MMTFWRPYKSISDEELMRLVPPLSPLAHEVRGDPMIYCAILCSHYLLSVGTLRVLHSECVPSHSFTYYNALLGHVELMRCSFGRLSVIGRWNKGRYKRGKILRKSILQVSTPNITH